MKAAVIGIKWVGEFSEKVERALQSIGVDTLYIALYRRELEPNLFEIVSKSWASIKNKLSRYCDSNILGQQLLNSIIARIKLFEPDLIVLVGIGIPLCTDVIRYFKKAGGVKIVQWIADPIDRFPYICENLKYCDYFYSANPFITLDIKKLNLCKTDYLPLACSSEVEKKLSLSAEEIKMYSSDVSFVGHIKSALVNRWNFFNEIIDDKSDIRLKIWDDEAKDVIKTYPQFTNFMEIRPIDGLRKVKVYNASRINLNLHHEGYLSLGNLRFFEIPSCGGFQLSNKKEQARLFESYIELIKYTVFFESVKEFKELVYYYLKNENERMEMSAEAQKIVHDKHTFTLRVKKILNDVGLC